MSIAEKFEVIADAVYDKGISDRDELVWNMITDNGTRTNFHNAFQYTDFSGYKFVKPIKPIGYVSQMFYSCQKMKSLPQNLDFSEILLNGGDTSSTYRRSVFGYCRVLTTIPDLNMRAIGGLEEWFQYCNALHTIELLRVKRETIYTNTFTACEKLAEIRFDGEIGQNISFSGSPLLSTASIVNIVEHLSDNQSATLTLKTAAKNNMTFPYTSPQTNVTYNNWDELVATKSGWTISLA